MLSPLAAAYVLWHVGEVMLLPFKSGLPSQALVAACSHSFLGGWPGFVLPCCFSTFKGFRLA